MLTHEDRTVSISLLETVSSDGERFTERRKELEELPQLKLMQLKGKAGEQLH